jgi:hypothetical protein
MIVGKSHDQIVQNWAPVANQFMQMVHNERQNQHQFPQQAQDMTRERE